MISDSIYSMRRKSKRKSLYLACLSLFDKKIRLTLDEFIALHKERFGRSITREQAAARLHKLKFHGYIRNAGLRVYKKITDPENEKGDEYYQSFND